MHLFDDVEFYKLFQDLYYELHTDSTVKSRSLKNKSKNHQKQKKRDNLPFNDDDGYVLFKVIL